MRRQLKLTIQELERALAQQRTRLNKLQRRRDKLTRELRLIDDQIVILAPGGGGPRAAYGARRGRRRRGQSLRTYIHAALKAHTSPMKIKDIDEAVKKAGYKSQSRNLPNLISQIVYRDDAIKKVGPGRFKIKASA